MLRAASGATGQSKQGTRQKVHPYVRYVDRLKLGQIVPDFELTT
jgi:hypothetical protein